MRKTLLELDPERDKIFWTAVSATLKKLRQRPEHAKTPWPQLEVESLIAACNDGDETQRVPALIVLADIDTLRSGLHANSICETDDATPLPVEVVRRLACDAEIIPVILNSKGEALAVGRSHRLATPAQRAALSERCTAPACNPTCTVPFEDCPIHHIIPWEQGGATDLSNLGPLCAAHHHLVHQGGWTLTMTADRIATWTRPDGTISTPVPPSTAHPTASPHPTRRPTATRELTDIGDRDASPGEAIAT